MSGDSQNLALGEAASLFLMSLSPEGRGVSQSEVNKFVRWFGKEHPLSGLTATEVANYAERLSVSDTDYSRKLELLRAFLGYAKKKGWSKNNLGIHLKTKKGESRLRSSSPQASLKAIHLTRSGYAELETELAALQSKRLAVIEEMRRAAADKDFRENAPLQAAKEVRGQIEGRIMELVETLKSAVIIDEERTVTLKVEIGDSVILGNLDSGEEFHYTLVSPREVDPAKNKISSASPIGQAIIGKKAGETVEIRVPVGKLRYQIKQIGH